MINIKKVLNKELLRSPILFLSGILILLLVLIFYLISNLSFGVSKYLVSLGLFFLAVLSLLPERFRPPISLSVVGVAVILFSVVYGPVVGYAMSVVLHGLWIYIGKYYYPMYALRVFTISSVILGVLPSYLGIVPSNLAKMGGIVLGVMFLVALPFRVVFQEAPLFKAIPSALASVYWQYLILKYYGFKILELLL